jgi:type IV pilus assembly protein PilW
MMEKTTVKSTGIQLFGQRAATTFSDHRGFTMIELLVAMVISAIVLSAIYATHNLQQRTYRHQTMVVNTQQNLRGALYMLQKELLMAGYDRNNTGQFGIESVLRINNNSAIEFTGDFGPGNADNGTLDGGERIAFQLFDSTLTSAVGNFDLGRRVDGGTIELLAEGIEAFGLAFAYDENEDGRLDFVNLNGNTDAFGNPIQDPGENVIWAVDSDGDGDLDRSLDDNNDGTIDMNDTTGGVSLTALGLDDNIPVERIRAIQIWLLGRTRGTVLGQRDSRTYVIGGRRLTFNDFYQRRLLTSIITCRNLGL